MRCSLLIAVWAASALQAQEPTLFAPGIISGAGNELSPAFAPDGRSVWFTTSDSSSRSTIVTSHLVNGTWTTPTVAEFSGHWRDLEAAMAPDGSYLVFASNRPATDGGAPLDGNYGGKVRPGIGGNLWRVDRRGAGWGTPVRLPDVINANGSIFSPSVVADGSLYFMQPTGEAGRFQIYRAQFRNGQYEAPVRVSFSDEQWTNVDPAVAPDESFAVFSSSRPPTGPKDLDLFIVYREHGTWGTPRSLTRANSPKAEIEARLSPDGHMLYFSSNRPSSALPGNMHIWSVPMAVALGAEPRGAGSGD